MSHPFLGELDAADWPIVYAEARRLLECALADPLLALLQDRLARCCGEAVVAAAPPAGDGVDPAALAAVHRRLVVRERIMKAPVPAAVAAQPGRQPDGTGRADILGGWVVAAALLRIGEEEADEHCVVAGADALRLLKTLDPPPDLARIDLAGVTGFVDAVKRLRLIRSDPGDEPVGPMFGDRLEKLHALFNAVATGRDRDERTPTGRHWREQSLAEPEDDDGPDLIDVYDDGPGDRDDADRAQPEEERRADAPRNALHVARAAATVDDSERSTAQTRTGVAAAATRALALPAEPNVVTPHEVRVIIDAARAAPHDAALQVLALVLVFGRRAERLKDAFAPKDAAATARWSFHRAGYALDLSVKLPELNKPGALIDEPHPRPAASESECIRLIPPPWLDVEKLYDVDKEDLDRAMAALRPRLAYPLSQGRIARWLQAWLQRKGVDIAVIGVLCGLDPGARAQMHYTVLSGDAVRDAWEQALTEGLGLDAPPQVPAAARIGSSVRPDDGELREAVARLAECATTLLDPAAPLSALAAVHEAFALYTLELLFLSTGHRPVSAPFGQIGDYDLATGVMWISDKDTRGGPASRIVALPPFAIDQLRFWEDHLRALAARLEHLRSPVPRARIKPIFAPPRGRAPEPLFFFLDESGRVVEASQAAMGARRRRVLPGPTNAARHMLRTHLVASAMPTHAIDAALGHGRLGEEPLVFDSSLGFGDLQRIAMAAQALLEAYGFTPLRSPL